MAPEAGLDSTEHGLVPRGEGWFVLNARDARWLHAQGRSAICHHDSEQDFPQVGINLNVLEPGVPMAMYHWEADQEISWCSRGKRCSSSRAMSVRSASGTSCTAPRARSTSSSVQATDGASC